MNKASLDYAAFISMNKAIKRAVAVKIDVKAVLGKELVSTFDQLQYEYYTEYDAFSENFVGESFAESRDFRIILRILFCMK